MKNISLCILLAGLFFACSKKNDDPGPAQLLQNSNMENDVKGGLNWIYSIDTSGLNFDAYAWSTEAASSGNHSLKIQMLTDSSSSFHVWSQKFAGPFPFGKDMTFTARIKGKSLNGNGVGLEIYTDTNNLTLDYVFTETAINGTFDWTTYRVKLIGLKQDVIRITVLMYMKPGTRGTVYFDDASLTSN
jgi:hypothetical protein